ncbi:UNVERIFIED_ORG: hypothetical protein M2348_000705 [Sphingomonas sp. R1F5B]
MMARRPLPATRAARTRADLVCHLASVEVALADGQSAGIDPQSIYLAALRALVAIFRQQLRQDPARAAGENA